MKSKCVNDPSQHTQLCVTNNIMEIQLLRNGLKAYNQVVKNIQKSPLSSDEKQYYLGIMNDVMKTKSFRMDLNDIEAVTCHTDQTNNKDQMIVLHTKSAMDTGKFEIPIKPFNMQKNKCNNFVDMTGLREKKEHPSLFQDHVKQILGNISK
mgnify:CR=1 FL=1